MEGNAGRHERRRAILPTLYPEPEVRFMGCRFVTFGVHVCAYSEFKLLDGHVYFYAHI